MNYRSRTTYTCETNHAQAKSPTNSSFESSTTV